jgi:hypothetical protein
MYNVKTKKIGNNPKKSGGVRQEISFSRPGQFQVFREDGRNMKAISFFAVKTDLSETQQQLKMREGGGRGGNKILK